MATYKTPDVYVEEISVFPPSVAEVETCIPAFIGYTEKATRITSGDLKNKPTRIKSLLEFENYFGAGPEVNISQVTLDAEGNFKEVTLGANKFYLYNSMRLFYMNGGGDCYIVSIGSYSDTISVGHFTTGLTSLENYDEPTLILYPDAVGLGADQLYGTLQQLSLGQCGKLMDRFCIFDLLSTDANGSTFRDKVGINNLKYGSAYTPWLNVSMKKNVSYDNLKDSTSGFASKIRKQGSSTVIPLRNLTSDQSLKNLIDDYDAFIATDKAAMAGQVEGSNWMGLGGSTTSYRDHFDEATTAYNAVSPAVATMSAVASALYKGMEQVNNWAAASVFSSATLKQSVKDSLRNNLRPLVSQVIAWERQLEALDLGAVNAMVDHDSDPLTPTISNLAGDYSPAYKLYLPATMTSQGWQSADGTADNIFSVLPAASTDLFALTDTTDVLKIGRLYSKIKEIFETIHKEYIKISNLTAVVESSLESSLFNSMGVYQNIINGINDASTAMPPSGAIAGVFATTDRDRGVWKAPANVSLIGVVSPDTMFSASELDALNIDAVAGKSINAIRAFTGKGTLVWGSRTLAGNDNEWRYVPVRRFFSVVEESIKKSTYWAVFEPNNANTWVKVKGMIENYLANKWKEGALVGGKPDEAYFVKIGIGQTMTAQDVLEGYMKVEIGMAVVRPAEFIVLKFSHKLQQS